MPPLVIVLPLIEPEAMRPELVTLSVALRPTMPQLDPTTSPALVSVSAPPFDKSIAEPAGTRTILPLAALSMIRLPPPVETMPPVMSPLLLIVVVPTPVD